MSPFYSDKDYVLYNGNMLEVLDTMQPNSIDSIVTDPPYEIDFMNKSWDSSNISFSTKTWEKCLNVLKPGAYMLAFGAPRKLHRLMCAIEDAGFEIRDCIMWLYSSGFPKSNSVALAIDKKNGCPNRGHAIQTASRNRPDGKKLPSAESLGPYQSRTKESQPFEGYGTSLKPAYEPIILARKPLEGTTVDNVLKYGVGALNIDECRIGDVKATEKDYIGRFPANIIVGENSDEKLKRYFYSYKCTLKDREEGIEKYYDAGTKYKEDDRHNIHPTVKPTELMQYLVRLISPKGSTILDPFMGSGSTGKAVMYENKERNAKYRFIGIELNETYTQISKERINYALHKQEIDETNLKKRLKDKGILTIYDFIGDEKKWNQNTVKLKLRELQLKHF